MSYFGFAMVCCIHSMTVTAATIIYCKVCTITGRPLKVREDFDVSCNVKRKAAKKGGFGGRAGRLHIGPFTDFWNDCCPKITLHTNSYQRRNNCRERVREGHKALLSGFFDELPTLM